MTIKKLGESRDYTSEDKISKRGLTRDLKPRLPRDGCQSFLSTQKQGGKEKTVFREGNMTSRLLDGTPAVTTEKEEANNKVDKESDVNNTSRPGRGEGSPKKEKRGGKNIINF